MPTPRYIPELDAADREMIEDLQSDAAANSRFAVAHASYQVERLMPTIRAVLAEAKDLLPRNPSASVVWSVQALEVFLKDGVLRPTLQFRLGFDPGLADSIFENLFRGHGSLVSTREWLSRILGTNIPAYLTEIGRPSLWIALWPKPPKGRNQDRVRRTSIIEWRNDIVHRAFLADKEDARFALQAVTDLVEALEGLLRSARDQRSGATTQDDGQ